jgi:hypothetical protein
VRGSVKAWVPATVVAVLLAAGIGTAAYFTLGRGTDGSPSPTPTSDLHSKEAVIAAIKHYYEVEAEARKTGNADLIDPLTLGHTSLASQNFHAFMTEQASANRRSVIDRNYFSDWSVTLARSGAIASYKWWLHGHDTDAKTGLRIEADMTSTKGSYEAKLVLSGVQWLISEVQLLLDNVP